MTVNLSLLGGAGWQFLDNNGSPLSGGLLYTYAAGTSTPQTTYTSNTGLTAQANPIVLDSAGRIPSGGEIWLTQGQNYKFFLKTSAGVTLGTYDNVSGASDPANVYAALAASSGSSLIGFIQSGAVATTVQTKLRESVSVKDFGAVGDGIADDTVAIQAAYTSLATAKVGNAPLGGGSIYFPPGTYKTSAAISIVDDNVYSVGYGATITPTHTGVVFNVGPASETRQFVVFDSLIVKPIATTSDIIQFNSGTMQCKVLNCRFEGATGVYTTGYGVNFNATTVAFNNNNLIQGTYFRWLYNGVKDGSAQVVLAIENCRFSNLAMQAITIEIGGLTTVLGCNFETCGSSATVNTAIVQFGNSPTVGRFILEGCHFENNGSTSGNKNFDLYINNARSALVIGNRFYAGAGYPTLQAIQCNSSSSLTFISNEYEGYTTGAVGIPSTNSEVVYFGNKLVGGQEFIGSGSNGISKLGFAGNNFNLQLGSTGVSSAFAIKDSTGSNSFIVWADGSFFPNTLGTGASTPSFTATNKPGATAGAGPAKWFKLYDGTNTYWVPAWLN